MKPPWCPHPDCLHVTGGGSDEETGVACGGKLPRPEPHGGVLNTHRLCIRTAEGDVTDLQVHRGDLFYLGRIVKTLHASTLEPK